MNKITKFSAVALFASMAFTGCIKETQPTTVVTAESVAASSTAVEALVNAIAVTEAMPHSVYSNVHFDFGLPSILITTDTSIGDVVTASGDIGSNYDWFDFWSAGYSLNSNQYAPFTWYAYYGFIKSANDVIRTIVEPETDNMKAYLAYAKASRASFYLDMARAYDPLENEYTDVSAVKGLTIPKITEATTEDEARNNPRMTRQEAFDFILGDLKDAETLLTGNSFSGGKTTPSLGVVYGLMARAYLWLGGFDSSNYAQAATYARKALETSGASVMSEAQWLDPKTGFNTPNNSWMWYIPQSSEGINNLLNYVGWLSFEGTWGYGFMVGKGVTPRFYDNISDTDFRKRAFLGPDPIAWYEENSAISNLDIPAEIAAGNNIFPYAAVKFRPANGETLDYNIGNVTNVCVMRAEEMILTEIEALAYTDPATAVAKLNEFMLTRDPNYSFKSSDSAAIVAETIWQKRVELWGEGVLFYDFKRLNYGIQNGYKESNVPTTSKINTNGRAPWWNWVIPEQETQQNTILKTTNNPEVSSLVEPWAE